MRKLGRLERASPATAQWLLQDIYLRAHGSQDLLAVLIHKVSFSLSIWLRLFCELRNSLVRLKCLSSGVLIVTSPAFVQKDTHCPHLSRPQCFFEFLDSSGVDWVDQKHKRVPCLSLFLFVVYQLVWIRP